jgi:uncharacterized protein YggE
LKENDIMQSVRGTLATRGILILIGALIAIAASAVTAVAVRAGAGGGSSPSSLGAGAVAGPRDTITVVGEGTQNATPDNAVISLGVSTKQPIAGDAMNAANTEMTALLKAIKGQGVQDVDIQTTGIGLYQDQQNYIGYRASNTVNVKIHHITNIGTVISAAQGAVGNDIQINGISLQLSDNTNQLKGARQAAMNAAAARAKDWANLAGRHLGKVLSVSEVIGGSSYSPCGAGGQCGGGGGGAPIQAGQMNVTVDVAVVYELTD